MEDMQSMFWYKLQVFSENQNNMDIMQVRNYHALRFQHMGR